MGSLAQLLFLQLFSFSVVYSQQFEQVNIKWYILGPFQCGMNEVDGIPMIKSSKNQSSDNAYNLPSYPTKSDRKLKFYSELAQNGYIKWKKINIDRDSQLTIQFSSINWNALIQSMQHTEILQWQSWLIGKFKIAKETKIKIACTGISTYWLDTIGPIAADQYGNRPFAYFISLSPGTHYIKTLVRAKHQTRIKCILKQATDEKKEKEYIQISKSQRNPNIIDGKLSSSVIGITVQNLSPIHHITLKNIQIIKEYDHSSFSIADKQPKWFSIYPNQISILPIYINSNVINPHCKMLSIKLNLSFDIESERSDIMHLLQFECRQIAQSFEFTFIDKDGSVQHAAAIHPLSSSLSKSSYPLLINLHGTGVTARSSADSYKYKNDSNEEEEYTFGIENMWVLAPTRHGAHNWEGMGKNTVMSAMNALIKYSKQSSYPIDGTQIIFAGHSMGGHGAMVLGINYPDLALAVIPQSGWYRKEHYGDSNTLFLYDLQNSFLDVRLKSILEATINENAVDLHVSNLKNVPVFIRVGSADQVVNPWWSRRIIRLLNELHATESDSFVKYHEIKSKDHWWWDTLRDNDGGVANDEEMRTYFKHILAQPDDENICNLDFTLTVYNPSSVSSKNGIRILQTWKSYQKATVHVFCDEFKAENECFCKIYTMNVRRIGIDANKLWQQWNGDRKIMIDDKDLMMTQNDLMICASLSGEIEWTDCLDSDSYELSERSPISYGPIRQVFESRFRIVYGTKGSEEMIEKYKEWAIYLTNLWFMTGDCANIKIHSDEYEVNLNDGENVLLIGDNLSNKWSKKLMKENEDVLDFERTDNFVRFGPCLYKDSFGFMTIFPIVYGTKLHLGAMIGGSDLERMHEIVLMAKPTIPPMTRQPFSNTLPDFIITGKDTFSKGYAGIIAAGFWRFDWKYDAETSYSSCIRQNEHTARTSLLDTKIEL